MTLYKELDVRRKLIMDHYTNPRHYGIIPNVKSIDIYSDSCVDELFLYVIKENNVVKTASWRGQGCAVFKSSTDIFIKNILGKTVEECKNVLVNYKKMISSKEYDENSLGELNVFSNVDKQLNRKTCAELIARGLEKAL